MSTRPRTKNKSLHSKVELSCSQIAKVVIWALVCMDLCHSFDINDPNTNLESLVRVTGSLSPDNSTIAYINGTVYYRLPGETAKKILNFEGYNINRKEREKEGNYMSLSCEFVVYRDPVTSEILKVWMNPMTSQPNEVFAVQNDPVDAVFVLGDVIKTVHASSEQLAFELNIDLSYPNVLGPQKYPKFSAGDTYKGTELFTYLSNYTELSTSQSDSVPFFGTWQRSSQFLPWMEMGTTPGHLIYNTFFWKCDRGLACIADDILELIRSDGLLKYLTAPVWYEVPNDTSWSVFKSKIDARRAANLSDIIIPMVNSTGHPIINLPQVDRKIVSLLENQKHIPFRFNGSVFTSLNGNQIDLYRLEGNATATVSFNASASQHEPYMTIQCKYSGYYRNASSGVVITTWTNPLTNRSLDLPDVYGSEFISFDRNDIYTNDIPDNDVIGLIGVSSTTQGQKLPDDEIWTVSMPVLAFPLPVVVDVPRFYGTWTIFSNYPAWMGLGKTDGFLKTKLIVSLDTGENR